MTTAGHSEDDTFNILRRTPIEILDYEYVCRQWEFYSNPEVYASWLDQHGWDDVSFRKAGSLYLQSLTDAHNERLRRR